MPIEVKDSLTQYISIESYEVYEVYSLLEFNVCITDKIIDIEICIDFVEVFDIILDKLLDTIFCIYISRILERYIECQ